MRTKTKLLLITALAALGVQGCWKVGPDYKLPETPIPMVFSQADAALVIPQALPDSPWWESFGDPKLNELLRLSADQNKDIALAVAKLKESRGFHDLRSLALSPTIDTEAGYTASRLGTSAGPNIPKDDRRVNTWSAGVDVDWELDVFGRLRRAMEAGEAREESASASLEDARRLVAADVAKSYIELRGSQLRLDVARKNTESQSETVRLTAKMVEWGRSSEFDTSRARAQLESTRASIPVFENQVDLAIHRLSVLLGRPPEELLPELRDSRTVPAIPEKIYVGDPTSLLRRRPDIRAAERELAGATAEVGLLMGDYFPKLSILGNFSYEGKTPSSWFEGGAEAYRIGPLVSWKIFNYNRVRADVKQASAQADQAFARYEQTTLIALEEGENALLRFRKERERNLTLQSYVQQSRRAAEIAREQFQLGSLDFLSVLEADRSYFQAEDQLADSQTQLGMAVVGIYKALAGGWPTGNDAVWEIEPAERYTAR